MVGAGGGGGGGVEVHLGGIRGGWPWYIANRISLSIINHSIDYLMLRVFFPFFPFFSCPLFFFFFFVQQFHSTKKEILNCHISVI